MAISYGAAMMILGLFLSTFVAATRAPAPCEAQVELFDGETGQSKPGLIRAKTITGEPLEISGLLSRGEGLDAAHPARRWWVLPQRTVTKVACGHVAFEAFSGLESHVVELRTTLRPGHVTKVRLPLTFFSHLRENGWHAGNTHLHLKNQSRQQADDYLTQIPRADGLEVIFLSYLERADVDRDYVSNGYNDLDLAELTQKTGVIFGSGEEQRHNFTAFGEGYGHQLFLNVRKLVRPVSIGPGIMNLGTDGWPLQTGADNARKDGATVLWCHNTQGTEGAASVILQRTQALNIFDGDPADHGLYADSFYRFLNIGMRLPFSTGTDWFLYDFSRVYVQAAQVRTPDDWLAALKAGRTFITNGPLLSLQVQDHGIGDRVSLVAPGALPVRARAVGRSDFHELQLVRNGEVIARATTVKQGRLFLAELTPTVEITEPSWLAVRIPPPADKGMAAHAANELGAPLFAHTSPVYIDIAGRRTFVRTDAEALRRQMANQAAAVSKQAVFGNNAERQLVFNVYAQALARLNELVKQAEVPR